MTSIVYVGLDVHTTSYSVCAYSMENQNIFAETSFTASAENVEAYLNSVSGGFEKPYAVWDGSEWQLTRSRGKCFMTLFRAIG